VARQHHRATGGWLGAFLCEKLAELSMQFAIKVNAKSETFILSLVALIQCRLRCNANFFVDIQIEMLIIKFSIIKLFIDELAQVAAVAICAMLLLC